MVHHGALWCLQLGAFQSSNGIETSISVTSSRLWMYLLEPVRGPWSHLGSQRRQLPPQSQGPHHGSSAVAGFVQQDWRLNSRADMLGSFWARLCRTALAMVLYDFMPPVTPPPSPPPAPGQCKICIHHAIDCYNDSDWQSGAKGVLLTPCRQAYRRWRQRWQRLFLWYGGRFEHTERDG